jgi:hypothetical protein
MQFVRNEPDHKTPNVLSVGYVLADRNTDKLNNLTVQELCYEKTIFFVHNQIAIMFVQNQMAVNLMILQDGLTV